MKKIRKSLKKLIKIIIKQGWNIAIAILIFLVIFLGSAIVGIVKTTIILGGVVLLVAAIRFVNIVIKKKKKKKEKKEPTDKKPKKKWKRRLNLIILIILWAGIISVLGGIVFLGYVVASAPKFDAKNLYYKEASIFYDKNNNEILRIGEEMRDKATYDEIPQVLIDAIVATEDSRFFSHNGFDLPRFIKATMGQVLGKGNAGGGSTISMQVIKNNFTSRKQTIVRKLTDIYLAVFQLEKRYTKEQILEFYVNKVHFGINNTLGIVETAKALFGKDISDINLSEAALLAGMFQAPYSYNPYRFPEKAAARRSTVLYLMERHGYITSEERKIANKIPVESMVVQQEQTVHPYRAYVDYAAKEVYTKTGYDPMVVPMKVYTNLDPKKQDFINDVLSGKVWKWENDLVQSGIAVTDVNTGAILALGPGRNKVGAKLWNFATDSKKQIGSTAKPLFDYGPGMEFNNWSTYTPFVDDRYGYSNGVEVNNWDSKYYGMQTLRYALGQSRNIPAVKAFQQVDNKKIIEFVQSLGITPEIESDRIHEAHAIGGFNGASPLQMAAAYAAFSNGGYYIAPIAVNKIEFMDNNEVETYSSEKIKVMSDSTAYMITDILRYAVDNRLVGGGRTPGVEVATKSGTTNLDDATKKKRGLPSNAINDLWCVGYSPDISIAMWYGYEELNSKYYSKSPSTAGVRDRLFTTIANGIFEKNGKTFTMPSSVVKVKVEKGTIPAMLPSPYTPSDRITTEVFKKGTEPTEVSPRFNTLPNVVGLDVTKEGNNVRLSWTPVVAPNMITDEYLATIAAQKNKYLEIRNNEDASILGTLGYNVYIKNPSGELTLLGWTASTNYVHKPSFSGSLTYVVKTSYSIFKASESTGATATLSDNPYVAVPMINLKEPANMNIIQDNPYTDPGISVLLDGNDVTNEARISIHVTSNDDYDETFDDIDDIDIDTSVVGTTYTLTYDISYQTTDVKLTRKVTVIGKST